MKKIAQKLLIAGMVMVGILAGAVVGYAAPFAYIPDGSHSVLVIDQATNKIATAIDMEGYPLPIGVAVNAAGTRVYITNSESNTVSVIDGVTQTVIGDPITVGTQPIGIEVNPSGSTVYVANRGSNSISVINTATNSVDYTIPDVPCNNLAIDPSGTRLYVGSYDTKELRVINTVTRTILGGPLTSPGNITSIALNPTGTHLYVANTSNSVYVIRTADLAITEVPIGEASRGVAIHPSGSFVYVGGSTGFTLYIIDAGTNDVIGSVGLGNGPSEISFNSDGTRAYVPLLSEVKVIDAVTHTLIDTIEASGDFGGFCSGQFVALSRHIWSGTGSFPIKFTTLSSDGKFLKETGEFTGRVIMTRSLGKYSLLFLSDDLRSSIYLKDVTFLTTDVDGSKSEKIMLGGTGTYYFHNWGEMISGIAQFNGTGTLKRDAPGGNFTSASIKGTVAGGKLPDVGFAGQYFTGSIKATLDYMQ